MSRVGLLGGSFDPPHIAHQLICLWALSSERVDEVWLMPCDVHAFRKKLVPFADRRRMCELAVSPLDPARVQVCSIETEIDSGGKTLVTLEALIARHPACSFSLLVGADVLEQRDSWYRFDAIERLVEVIAIGRPGYPRPPGGVELSPISSTQVRERIADGQDVSALVPAAVLRYIEEHRLYV